MAPNIEPDRIRQLWISQAEQGDVIQSQETSQYDRTEGTSLSDTEESFEQSAAANNDHCAQEQFVNGEINNHDDDYFLSDIEHNSNTESEAKRRDDENVVDEPGEVHKYIRKLSNMVSDPYELAIDEERLSNAAREAGEYAAAGGVIGVEVWVYNDDSNCFVIPKGGWWRSADIESDALRRLEDKHRPDYIPSESTLPGVDLVGVLWASSTAEPVNNSSNKRRGSARSIPSVKSIESLHRSIFSPSLVWRDIKSLIVDPDTAKSSSPRLALLDEAGFGLATGIPFNIDNGRHKGIVVYYANKYANVEVLSSVTNKEHLRGATNLIGAIVAWSECRRALIMSKVNESNHLVSKRRGEHAEPSTATWTKQDDKIKQRHKRCIFDRIVSLPTKCQGGKTQIPPTFSIQQTCWTILGAFLGLLTLSGLNECYQTLSDDDYFLLIGPFGALMTLQYGLTAAPASQPRNAVLGQAVAGGISLAFTYIPETIIPVWLRTALGPAFSIGAMVKLGITHPPAGAHAVLYASGKYNWVFYSLVVLSSAVSILPAVIVNNLSTKRTYPTYWGYIPAYVRMKFREVFSGLERRK